MTQTIVRYQDARAYILDLASMTFYLKFTKYCGGFDVYIYLPDKYHMNLFILTQKETIY